MSFKLGVNDNRRRFGWFYRQRPLHRPHGHVAAQARYVAAQAQQLPFCPIPHIMNLAAAQMSNSSEAASTVTASILPTTALKTASGRGGRASEGGDNAGCEQVC